jgi:Fibronectin type III domain
MADWWKHIFDVGAISAISGTTKRLKRIDLRLVAVLVVMALLLSSLAASGTTKGLSRESRTAVSKEPAFALQLYRDVTSTLASIGTWASHVRPKSVPVLPLYEPVTAYITPAPPFIDAPGNLQVTNASSAVISLSWNTPLTGGVDHYLIERSNNISGPFLPLPVNMTGTTHNDGTVTNLHAYLYRVRAVSGSGVVSAPSNMALGTAISFEFDELDNQLIRARHFNDVRTAINLVRTIGNRPEYSWARGSLAGLEVKADDVTELRTALDDGLTALSIPLSAYQDSPLNPPGNPTLIKATHLEQLQLRSTRGSSNSSGPIDPDSSSARLDPINEVGGGADNPLSRNFNWNLPLVSLHGRAGMDLGLTLSYNSLVWTKIGNIITFDKDQGFPGPGFRIGYPVIEPIYFNAEVGKDAYLLIDSDGSRVELRHLGGTSTLYQAADSSYLLFDSSNLVLRNSDGTQFTYAMKGTEYKCTKVKDRNGNYISVSYTTGNQINTITDTLGRVLTFNYDGTTNELTSISQVWNQSVQNPPRHYWARFYYAEVPIDINFKPGIGVIGPTDGAHPRMLTQVKIADNSHFDFTYTSWGQVWKITNVAPDDTSILNYRSYNLPKDGVLEHDDCPRFTIRNDWARYWNGDIEGTPDAAGQEEAHTTYIIPTSDQWTMPSGGNTINGVRAQVTTPDGTLNKIYYFGAAGSSTGWQRGLPTLVDTYSSGGSQPVQREMTIWTQDNPSSLSIINPRVAETSLYNAAGNRSRTQVTYQQLTLADTTAYSVPTDIYETGNSATILRTIRTDYKLDASYTNLRILGLVRQKRVYEGDANNSGVLLSNLEMFYDESNSIDGDDAPTQHDHANYPQTFSVRGNVTSVKRNNVTANPSQSTLTHMRYNTTGAVVSIKDALNHEVTMSYGDSFSDDVARTTLAYPTILNDPGSYSTTWKYNFDFGRITRRQTPKPNEVDNIAGPEQTFTYDDKGRLERITNVTNSSYKRFVYPDDQSRFETYTTVKQSAGEVKSFVVFDGAGRNIGSASTFPGSSGGYSGQRTSYDVMGRAVQTSNPADTSAIGLPWDWIATGDSWHFAQQTYDWKNRPLVSTNTDNSTKEASYSGCGCAAGEVVTLKDEGTMVSGVLRRRTQKLYTDALGRVIKTEMMKWDGTTVDSTYVNVYDALDRVLAERHYKDAAPADAELPATSCPTGICLQTTSTYDGYGRLKTKHSPEQKVDPTNSASTDSTTWDYRDDDTVEKVTDARGAVINYTYNSRHLVTQLTYTTLPGVPTSGPTAIQATPAATFTYDGVGNRTRMDDGSGYVTYEYDQLSRRTSELRHFNVSTRNYTFTYQYNLVNDLTSVSDSLGAQIDYTRDEAGKLDSVSGTGTAISSYVSSYNYTAWGGIKHITYGNNITYDVGFDQRKKPVSLVVTGANPAVPPFEGPLMMNATFEYYDDGRVKGAADIKDHKFDRAYSYDHMGRLENSFTNQQARDFLAGQTPSTTDQGPYRESVSYDFHGNRTQRVARYWSQPQETVNFTFDGSSNRLVDSTSQYDAEGHVVLSDGQYFKYDVAGQLARVGIENEWMLRDGDGMVVERVTRDGSGHDFRRKYDVYSSVIGQMLIEDSRTTSWSGNTQITDGWYFQRFIYADDMLIARESKPTYPAGNWSTEQVWVHQNPVTGSTRTSDQFSSSQMRLPAELDSAGIDVGAADPAENESPPDDGGSPSVRDFELGQQCAINGITFDCSTPLLNKAGSFFVCPNNECSGVRWNPNVEVGQGLRGAWEFFHMFGNGYSGWMTPYGFAHYEGTASFYNSGYEDYWEKKTRLTRVREDFSNHSISLSQGTTTSQTAQPACNVQVPNDVRSQVFVGIALTETSMADYKNGVLEFEQFTKDLADKTKITFQGQAAEDELGNEIYYMASAMINRMADGDYKSLQSYAMSESVGYKNDYDEKTKQSKRLSQLAYPVYCLKARLMLEKLAYIDKNGAAKDENGNPIRFWRGVDQGGKRVFRKGDVRAANTDFMYLPPQSGGTFNKVYFALPYWKNGQWNEVGKKKKK